MLGDHLIIPAEREGIVKKGMFIPGDLATHEIVDKSKNFILPKGKYRISLRNAGPLGKDDPVGMAVIDNSRDSYDKFWGSEEMMAGYLTPERTAFYREVVLLCQAHLRGRIVDIGCGSGDFLTVIKQKNSAVEVSGIDFSRSAVERCRRLMPEGEFTAGSLYETGYADQRFDAVVSMETLEHLERPQAAFKEMRRICRENGRIIVTIPNGDCDDYVGHLNFWSEAEFRSFLGDAVVIDFQYLQDKTAMLFVIRN